MVTRYNQFNVTITKSLLNEYEKNNYPDKQSKVRLALQVGLTSKQVQNWFHKRRLKLNESKNSRFNVTTTKILNEEYEKNKYPDQQTKVKLALQVGLTLQQVSRWYKSKRRRFNDIKKKYFDETVTNALLKEYEKNKYPSKQSFDRIASKVNLTFEQVCSWFKYKRNKLNESKTKKVKFSVTATKALFKEYGKNKYPDKKSLNRIASLAGLTFNQVVSWFKHKRNRNK